MNSWKLNILGLGIEVREAGPCSRTDSVRLCKNFSKNFEKGLMFLLTFVRC